jgi:hypothetical protein
MIAVVIETVDRRLHGGKNYLGQTIRNLCRATHGFNGPITSLDIVCNGVLDDSFERDEVWFPLNRWMADWHFQDGTRQQNGARAIRTAASRDAEWVLKLEDDLDFCDDFLGSVGRWLAKYSHAKVSMFSLAATFSSLTRSRFTFGEKLLQDGPSFPYVRACMARGQEILAHPARGYWGAQALLWRRADAQHLADWLGEDPALFDGKEYHRNRGHDLILQEWMHSRGDRTVAVACPSLVQHVGHKSNLNQPEIGHVQPFFEFPWPGREWRFK